MDPSQLMIVALAVVDWFPTITFIITTSLLQKSLLLSKYCLTGQHAFPSAGNPIFIIYLHIEDVMLFQVIIFTLISLLALPQGNITVSISNDKDEINVLIMSSD